MVKRLNENFQEALQFLALGAGIVLGLRLAYLGSLRLMSADGDTVLSETLGAFIHGYLLPEPNAWAVQDMGVGGRTALAVVLALLLSLILALLFVGIARILGKAMLPWAVAGGRLGLVAGGCWSLYAALALPPQMVTIGANGIELATRPAVFGEISLPWPAHRSTITWEAMERIHARTTAVKARGQGSYEEVALEQQGETLVIARLAPQGSDRSAAAHLARSHTERLATVLDSLRSR